MSVADQTVGDTGLGREVEQQALAHGHTWHGAEVLERQYREDPATAPRLLR
jgi:hypothetical protein